VATQRAGLMQGQRFRGRVATAKRLAPSTMGSTTERLS